MMPPQGDKDAHGGPVCPHPSAASRWTARTCPSRRRPPARFSVTIAKHHKRIGDASFARLTAFLAADAVIDADSDPAAVTALAEQTDKNIDAGEAVLFDVCPPVPDSIIATGDKKCLDGLAAAGAEEATCTALCRSLAGRMFCFEQVLRPGPVRVRRRPAEAYRRPRVQPQAGPVARLGPGRHRGEAPGAARLPFYGHSSSPPTACWPLDPSIVPPF